MYVISRGFSVTFVVCCVQQRKIELSELTEVQEITQGGFGVIHRAKHPAWGTVVYKELNNPSSIPETSRFVEHSSIARHYTAPVSLHLLMPKS